MSIKYRKFVNRETRQVIYAPAGRYGNFLNSIKKLVNYVRYNYRKYYIVHLTLTVAENIAELDHKHLHRVLQFIDKRLERAGSDFKYVAVKEQQDRGAIHYHVLCIYDKPYVFPAPKEIEASWKLGFIKVSVPKFKVKMKMKTVANYIGKYIGKGYEYETLNFKKSFSASQIKQIYKLTPQRLAEVISKFGKERAESFKCTYRKVFERVVRPAYTVKGKVLDEIKMPERVTIDVVMEFQSEWAYWGIYPEPF